VAATPAALPVPLQGTAAWTAVVTVHVAVAARLAGAAAALNVSIPGLPGGLGHASATLRPGDNDLAVTLTLPAAHAWWPAGLGAPMLYNATVTLQAGGDTFTEPLALGLRTVALHQPPAAPAGFFSDYGKKTANIKVRRGLEGREREREKKVSCDVFGFPIHPCLSLTHLPSLLLFSVSSSSFVGLV
jgi:hypothetical protein